MRALGSRRQSSPLSCGGAANRPPQQLQLRPSYLSGQIGVPGGCQTRQGEHHGRCLGLVTPSLLAFQLPLSPHRASTHRHMCLDLFISFPFFLCCVGKLAGFRLHAGGCRWLCLNGQRLAPAQRVGQWPQAAPQLKCWEEKQRQVERRYGACAEKRCAPCNPTLKISSRAVDTNMSPREGIPVGGSGWR